MVSIITRPKGSGQEMGKSRARAPPRKCDFSASLISPTNCTPGIKKRKNTCFEIISIRWVHLRGDAEGQARAASYFNGAVSPLKPKAKHAKVTFERPKRMHIDARSIFFDQKVVGPCQQIGRQDTTQGYPRVGFKRGDDNAQKAHYRSNGMPGACARV